MHLAALALDIGPGDSVVVPSMTFLATANAVRLAGAEVIFADVDPDTGLLTPDTLRAALHRGGGKAKAVFPVHLNGQTAPMPEIAQIARADGSEDRGGRLPRARHRLPRRRKDRQSRRRRP